MAARKKPGSPQKRKGLSNVERIQPDKLRKLLNSGHVVIPSNPRHKLRQPCAIGEGLRVKVNANIGTSRDHIDLKEELEKVRVAVRYGADTIMDLSTGGNTPEIRRRIIHASPIPVGTVPIYEAVCGSASRA